MYSALSYSAPSLCRLSPLAFCRAGRSAAAELKPEAISSPHEVVVDSLYQNQVGHLQLPPRELDTLPCEAGWVTIESSWAVSAAAAKARIRPSDSMASSEKAATSATHISLVLLLPLLLLWPVTGAINPCVQCFLPDVEENRWYAGFERLAG